jgi:hypothetical protein
MRRVLPRREIVRAPRDFGRAHDLRPSRAGAAWGSVPTPKFPNIPVS